MRRMTDVNVTDDFIELWDKRPKSELTPAVAAPKPREHGQHDPSPITPKMDQSTPQIATGGSAGDVADSSKSPPHSADSSKSPPHSQSHSGLTVRIRKSRTSADEKVSYTPITGAVGHWGTLKRRFKPSAHGRSVFQAVIHAAMSELDSQMEYEAREADASLGDIEEWQSPMKSGQRIRRPRLDKKSRDMAISNVRKITGRRASTLSIRKESLGRTPILETKITEEREVFDQKVKSWKADLEELEAEELGKLGVDHIRLLYLISLYNAPKPGKTTLPWMRKMAVMVFIYECVTCGKVLDYDYAPSVETVDTKRVRLNISQDGRDDLDDLTDQGMLYSLKLATMKHTSTHAYQVTDMGFSFLAKRLTAADMEAVHSVVYEPNRNQSAAGDALHPTEGLLGVRWSMDDELFYLFAESGYCRPSSVTVMESVSFVTSPHIPHALRRSDRQLTSNKARVADMEYACSSIKDPDVKEDLLLDGVRLLMAEWLPMGANQIVALNERLGSGNTVQGTFFSQGAHGGDDGMAMVQCSSEGLTEVSVLDHDDSGYCNFETTIHNNDNGGIIQAECVGVHVSNDGFVLYGCHLEAAMQAVTDGISLDNLSRVLMDVQNDTSKIMDSVVSSHQKIMLEITYDGDAIQRPKYTLIFARKVRKIGLTRSVQVADLMDREVSENELKQVLGDTQRGVNLSSSELLVIGKHGMLVAGPNSERHEVFLNAYLGLMARNSFMNHLFQRTFIVVDTLKRIRYLIENYQSDPNSLHNIRTMLSMTSGDIILLTEIQSYLYSQCFNVIVIPPAPPRTDIGATALFEILDMAGTSRRLNRRVHGMSKTINVLKGQLQALEAMADRVSAGMTSRVMEAVEANTKNMDDQYRYNLRASSALDILNVLMAGSLAFSIIDRVHGLYLGVAHEIAWANTFMKPIYNTPFALFALNLGWWGMIGSFIYLLMAHISERTSHVLCISFEVNTRLDFKALMMYLETKKVEVEDSQLQSSYQSDSTIESKRNLMYTKKVVWDEVDSIRWRGRPPRIEILVDEEYHHLLSVYIAVNTRQSRITVPEVKKAFFDELRDFGVIAGTLDGIEDTDVSINRAVSMKSLVLRKTAGAVEDYLGSSV